MRDIDEWSGNRYNIPVELDENKLRELLASASADQTLIELYRVIDGGMPVRITSKNKPTMTVDTRFYLDKLLVNHYQWQPRSTVH